jgi:dCMP deaminase
MRTEKVNYYLNIAETISKQSKCMRKKYGAVLVSNDEIISTGFNDVCRGHLSCRELDGCNQDKANSKHGDFSNCRAIHAEMNCIISASRQEMIGSTLFLVGIDTSTNKNYSQSKCCDICKRLIVNSGIETVITRIEPLVYRIEKVKEWYL